MPTNLFDKLSPSLAFATKLFSAAGLDLAAMIAKGDESALKLHLEGLAAGNGVKEAIEQATAALSADLAAAQLKVTEATGKVTALESRASLVTSTLATKGITFAADADAAKMKTALDDRLSMLAGEELAKRGLKQFPAQEVNDDPTKAKLPKADSKLTGYARTLAAFTARSAELAAQK